MQHNDLNIIIWNAKISAARSEFSARNWRMCKRFILNMIKEDIDLIEDQRKNMINEDLIISLYTTNFTEPLSYQGSAFLKLPKFP